VADHAASIEAEHHQAALKSLQLAHAGQRRATERVQEWEEQLDLDRKRDLLRADQLKEGHSQVDVEEVRQQLDALRRSGATLDSIAQHEKLLRTIEAEGIHSRQEEHIALDAEQQRHAMRLKERQAQWQHELAQLQVLGTMKADQLTALAALRAAVHDKQSETGTE
jgi:putative alpha-1,2-mannosidase